MVGHAESRLPADLAQFTGLESAFTDALAYVFSPPLEPAAFARLLDTGTVIDI